jgi:hypothetical protein
MTKIELWGLSTWIFIHSLVHNIHINATPLQIRIIYDFIYKICSLLPCDECSHHAIDFLDNIQSYKINSPIHLRHIIYIFHSIVNKRLNKHNISYRECCERYSNMNPHHFRYVFTTFLRTFNTDGNMNLMTDNYQRSLFKKNLYSFVISNSAVINGKIRIF